MKKKILSILFVLFLLSLSFNVTSIQLEKSITDCDYDKVDTDPNKDRFADQLCGLVFPENWEENAKFEDPIAKPKVGTLSSPLPNSWDWREEAGSLPAVRYQGYCGSCWAFAIVGALECAIRIYDGKLVDLSEQYLVSCAADSRGCDGGFFSSHNYHVNPGAVYEADFVYAAADLECISNLKHPYKIEDWAYIGDGGSTSIPSVQEIKQAIYDYGPVCVGMFVDSVGAFQNYDGGIFDTQDEQPNTDRGHGVVLVGWNDDPGYWILRNSWGEGWGEDGYMRIAYGCSWIGRGANFIKYIPGQSPPGPPGGDEGYIISFDVLEITNDPLEGYGKIDINTSIDDERPEWYYQVNFRSEGSNKDYIEKNVIDGFDWISNHTWNVGKKHTFKTKDPVVNITFCLFDKDKIGSDTADISALSEDSYFRAYYDASTDLLDEDKSNPFTKDGSVYTTVGDGKYNAKLSFSISVASTSHIKTNQLFYNNLFFIRLFNCKFFQIFNNMLHKEVLNG